MNIKMENVQALNDFFKGRKILITEGHMWEGEEVDFIEMVNKDDTVPDPKSKGNVDLRMKVKTRFGTPLLLESKYAFVIEKKIMQRPDQN